MNKIRTAGLESELQELITDAEDMENLSGGTFRGGTIDLTLSYLLGNKGYVCTWTYECQNNCR
mgnify:CR=1 FL=1